MKKGISLLFFTAVLGAALHAQVTIGGGFNFSLIKLDRDDNLPSNSIDGVGVYIPNLSGIGIGGSLFVDYVPPFGIPLSIGVEFGIDTTTDGYYMYGESLTAMPLLFRVGYHFDVARSLDLYLVGKIGVVFGLWSGLEYDYFNKIGEVGSFIGLGYGFDLGLAYYFTSFLGAFIEAGWNQFLPEASLKYPGPYGGTFEGIVTIVVVPRIFTAGLCLKF